MTARERSAWMLLSPLIVLVAGLAVYPVLRTVFLSLFTQNLSTGLEPVFSGFENYSRALADRHFWETVLRTLRFTVLAVGFELALGLAAALALHHSAFGRDLARTAALVPWVLPTSALALAWIWIFNDQFGVVNDLLTRTGLLSEPLAWLARPDTAFAALVAADVWKTTPFMTLLLLAGLQTIPTDVLEAAQIDGASRWQRLWRITLPLLRPTIFVAVLFRALQSFGIFDLVFVMTGGGPGGSTETVALYTYRNFLRYLDFGYGATLLVLGSVVLAAVTGLIWILLGRERR
ncbi:MAG: sugar ABC transporter permease [Terrimicrobiaceae bacterium]|nr:sugar ABC transporter permease [Terrimicrobiaceae bacterium]